MRRVLVVLALFALVVAPVATVGGQPAPPGANGTSTTNATNGTAPANATNATGPQQGPLPGPGVGPGAGGGGGFGIPSSEDLVNATLGAVADSFSRGAANVFLLPWAVITARFAPLEAVADGGLGTGLWARPPGLFGELYDLATGSMFTIAGLLFVLMFVIDWFTNFSPRASMGAVDRLFLRAADGLHLLFSWPIAWAHYLLASAVCLVFLPGQDAVAATVNEALTNVIGLVGAAAAVVVLPFLLVVVAWLLLKHGGALVYLIVGLAAYPILVAVSIPDHWLLGRLGAAAENARERYPIAAWYPVPTAVVLGIGYSIDGALLDLLTAGDTLNDAPAGAIVYPLLWLAALYAPVKVFGAGGLADQAKRAAPGAIAGGITGAAAGTAAGASAGAASGSAAGAASGGAAGGVSGAGAGGAIGAGSATASGALPEGRLSGSPGTQTLADGGATTVADVGGSAGAGSTGAGTVGAETTRGVSTSSADAIAPDRGDLDLEQRYEPVVQQDKGGFSRVERARNAEWLVDEGGVDRLDRATDEPLYFRGESDGELYDLRTAAADGASYGGPADGSESVRNT